MIAYNTFEYFRLHNAYKTGGLPVPGEDIQSNIRSFWNEILRKIGKKLLNGDFNLTRILVPTKCIQTAIALYYI